MKKILTGTLLAIVAAATWFVISLDDRIKSHIEKTGTTLAGVPVTIESLDLSLVVRDGDDCRPWDPQSRGLQRQQRLRNGIDFSGCGYVFGIFPTTGGERDGD